MPLERETRDRERERDSSSCSLIIILMHYNTLWKYEQAEIAWVTVKNTHKKLQNIAEQVRQGSAENPTRVTIQKSVCACVHPT